MAVVPRRAKGMGVDYTPRQVSELLADDEIQLIDVRAPHEHEAERIGAGRLIEERA